MVESFGAHYVSLHVRVSNQAAIHLYRDTLGFLTEKTESKYYADGEDAFCMKLELASIRDAIRAEALASEDVDEGEPVGDAGKALPDRTKEDDTNGKAAAADNKEKKRKVKVGRGLGVGELVERDESKH
jgi:N-alpha-acetyltransferase 10/11